MAYLMHHVLPCIPLQKPFQMVVKNSKIIWKHWYKIKHLIYKQRNNLDKFFSKGNPKIRHKGRDKVFYSLLFAILFSPNLHRFLSWNFAWYSIISWSIHLSVFWKDLKRGSKVGDCDYGRHNLLNNNMFKNLITQSYGHRIIIIF